jgi:hypothetical protein
MRRRSNPYTRIEEVRRSRSEVWVLVLVTVILGFLLGLLTEGLGWPWPGSSTDAPKANAPA